jgi:hypothetical protein
MMETVQQLAAAEPAGTRKSRRILPAKKAPSKALRSQVAGLRFELRTFRLHRAAPATMRCEFLPQKREAWSVRLSFHGWLCNVRLFETQRVYSVIFLATYVFRDASTLCH